MVTRTHSAQLSGLQPDIIDIEVDVSNGLHNFSIVGLPDKAVEEAGDRINAAIKHSGFRPPQKGNKKVVVALAPADLKKEGAGFDLGIAIAYLIANEELSAEVDKKIFLGELSLDGTIRKIKGILALAQKAAKLGFKEILVPTENAKEAALIENITVTPCDKLKDVVEHLRPGGKRISAMPKTEIIYEEPEDYIDFSDVRGQELAKRGLLIAAAGRHNLAMSGPPGTGKTMLARAFTSILPPLTFNEILETTAIHSSAGILQKDYLTFPPLRSPHHTSSYVALVGGGATPRPGEITLAHRGVLFLDEFPEFERRVIESLRQPLEDRVVTVSRAKGSVHFPADIILIATMNPCPCGNRGVEKKVCICLPGTLQKYERKLSGPIIDRIDLWVEVPAVSYEALSTDTPSKKTSIETRRLVSQAREFQRKRFANKRPGLTSNSTMSTRELNEFAPLSDECRSILNQAAERLGLSARAYHRSIKIARTIADLDSSSEIKKEHLLEALQYRPKFSTVY